MGFNGAEWIEMVQDRIKSYILVNMIVIHHVPCTKRDSVTT